MLKRLATGNSEITVGVHSQDGDVEKKGDEEGGGVRLIDVAIAHEFGLGVPRRSFVADWQDENADRHRKQVQAMAKAIVKGTVPNAEVAAERLANLWVAEVQRRIVAGIAPALHPKTIARKKSSTPLIDTGQLRSSIAYALNGKLHPSQAFEQATRERIKGEKKAKKQADRERAKENKQAARDRKKAFVAAKRKAKKAVSTAIRDLKRSTKKASKSAVRIAKKGLKKVRPKKQRTKKP